ncbi:MULTISPECIES: integrase [unclassified Vibrio]|uniref:integrase n=1 Tax=unclassified Vibrio TaxID=2614977 RepID=UPI00354BFFA9
MLTAVCNHIYFEELTGDIVDNPELLNGMHINTLSRLTAYAVEKDDFRVLALLSQIHTGIPMQEDYLPEWWLSDFHDDITKVKFDHQKKTKEIRWCDITLGDGKLLTNDKHKPLLNAFKFWLIAYDNPHENGGKLVSSKTAVKKYNQILVLINTILLNGDALKLPEFHLQKVTDEFWLKLLITIAKHSGSVINELYETNSRIKDLLDNVVVPTEEVEAFKVKYPHTTRELASDDITLNLKDRVKACCWLHKQRYYANKTRDKYGHSKPQGNNVVLKKLLFEGMIFTDDLTIPTIPELELKPIPVSTEYKAIANKERGNGSSPDSLGYWLNVIKMINTNVDKIGVCEFRPVTSDISVATIQKLATLRKQGRTKTLPPEFVFDLFRDSYELLKQFCPSPKEKGINFWANMLDLLVEANSKLSGQDTNPQRPNSRSMAFDESLHWNMPTSELGHWLKFEAIDLVHSCFKKLGVKQFDAISSSDKSRHTRIRNNESMLELFNILQGAVQLLVGAIMARRVDELVSMKPYGNLVYIDENGKSLTDSNPYIDDSEGWSLRFKVKKTGIKGKNLTEVRPIPLSIARFVWQLEQFNQQAIESSLDKKGELCLFNYIDTQTFKMGKRNSDGFNAAFDALCDYFETEIVEIGNGKYRRHYVRQHQLRRFFALVFFWSKGYENMEALRWMLAHSDLEHLHNYITESESGAVLNSAKASTIVQSVIGRKSMIDDLNEVEKLRKTIAKRLTNDASRMLHVKTLDEAVWDFEDGNEYQTVPHIKKLQAEQDLENEVLTLLEDGSIALYPEFFTVENENGEEVKSFNLILKVNELENE